MQRKKKGQALIEFVIILPIFVFMILAIVDLGKILYIANNLESKMDDVLTLYKADKTYDEIMEILKKDDENISFEATNENNKYVELKLAKNIEIITPGLNFILKNPYEISAKRIMYYE